MWWIAAKISVENHQKHSKFTEREPAASHDVFEQKYMFVFNLSNEILPTWKNKEYRLGDTTMN